VIQVYYDMEYRRRWCREQMAQRQEDYRRAQSDRPSAVARYARSAWAWRRRYYTRRAPAVRA
jgi:hypothetical protein